MLVAVIRQFWNCAEVRISDECDGGDDGGGGGGGGTTTTTAATATVGPDDPAPTTTTTQGTQNANCPNTMATCGPTVTCASLGYAGMCCSQWGYCGIGFDFCGTCCQNGPCDGPGHAPGPPPSTAPPTLPTPGLGYDADHGEDSRLIALVGNWQACPTAAQTDAYSHLVVAFAVSYTWSPSKNNCDVQCNIADTVPICNNQNNQALVDSWRAAGKKVILSFGGAGMGGSWYGAYIGRQRD